MPRAIGVNIIAQVDPSLVGLDAFAIAISGPFTLFSMSDDWAGSCGNLFRVPTLRKSGFVRHRLSCFDPG